MLGGPERTCVGCRSRSPKDRMLRVVATPDGPAVDALGAGRGAYVHATAPCVDAALSRGGFARALRARVGSEEVARLGTAFRSLMEAR